MMPESYVSNPFGGAAANISVDTTRHSTNNDSPVLSPAGEHNNAIYGQTTVNDVPLISPGGPRVAGASAMCSKSHVEIGDVHAKLDNLKEWSLSTFKCTKQALFEHLGKSNRTVDLELEQKIESLRDLQRRYNQVLALTRGFTAHFKNMTDLQKQMAEGFSDLAQKDGKLQEEFHYNAECQRTIVRQSDALLSSLHFYINSVQTLCEKTIEDTLQTVRNFEAARLEYDAYRTDLATLQQSSSVGGLDLQSRLHAAEQKCHSHKQKYEQLRDDVQVKLNFLDENRVKVMRRQLLLLCNSLSAYFGGNSTALEAALKQFSINGPQTPEGPNSFLENDGTQ